MSTTASSLVPSDVVSQLNQVLSSLVSNNNDLRSSAERQLNEQWITQQPELLLLSLAQLGRAHEETHGRSFSFVLLRRIAFKQAPNQASKLDDITIWDRLQEQSRQAIKTELLMSLSIERENTVRHKVCDAVSEVAKNSFLKGQKWNELLPALIEASESPNAEHREAALLNLQDANNAAIRMASLKAAVAFMLETDHQNRSSFAELMPQMLEVLSPLIAQRDEDGLADGIMVFIELAGNLPRIFNS
ncbi:unnamed protein product [Rhizophagus irregularis]|nr:unnamed protein product [Rhizophagus irregularis]